MDSKTPMKVAVVYHENFGKFGFSVLKDRIRPSFESLMKSGLVDGVEVQVFRPSPAPLQLIESVHSQSHMENMLHDPYREVAILSAGSVIMASVLVATRQSKSAFAYTGTAGHHASRGSCWGFCYFNDVAIAIKRLREMGLQKFLIVDVDPHFGDGTRDFFENDPDVFHINFHSGTESRHDTAMNNHDIGIGFGANNDRFLNELSSALDLAKGFPFEMCFLIFGHDSHEDDYGGFNLTLEAYPKMADMVKRAVKDRGLVVVLSGGSNVEVAKEAITSVISVLADHGGPA